MRKIISSLLVAYLLLTAFAVFLSISGYHLGLWITPINTLVGFGFSFLFAINRFGWKASVILLACVFTVSLGLESLGVATGLVYGPYHYTDQLGIKFLNLVPVLIPVAWFMMIVPSIIIGENLIIPGGDGGVRRQIGAAALAGVIMTAWDIGMDPMMVAAGHWEWEVDGAFFGVPIHNFIGWWFTTFLSVAIFIIATRKVRKPNAPLTDRMVVISYANQAIAVVITDLFIGLGGPGLAGFFAMLPWIIIGWISGVKKGG